MNDSAILGFQKCRFEYGEDIFDGSSGLNRMAPKITPTFPFNTSGPFCAGRRVRHRRNDASLPRRF